MKNSILFICMISLIMLFTGCSNPKVQTDILIDDLALETVTTGISQPWGMAFLNENQMLITQKNGKILLIDLISKTKSEVFTVAQSVVFGQGGLLDIAVHPNFPSQNWVYVTYSKAVSGGYTTAVGRGRWTNQAITDFEEIFVANAVSNSGQHFGSRIAFDKQGKLYVSVGDRGQMNQAQNTGNHMGKVLRLNADGSVPTDNPFVNSSGFLPEIFTLGNRNIQGMALNPTTGEIWSHEHGPQGGDEINVMIAGANYGWPVVTFGLQYGGAIISTDTAREGMTQPLLYWTPSIAPSGMAFITGDRYGNWRGNVVSGALAMQHLNMTRFENGLKISEQRFFVGQGRIRDVAVSPDHYIYMLNESNGTLSRVIPVVGEDD